MVVVQSPQHCGGSRLYTTPIWPIADLLKCSYKDSHGNIAGYYEIQESSSRTSRGTLSRFTPFGEYGAKFTWSDEYGTGSLQLLFSSNLEQFNGFWGTENRTTYHWSGIREVYTPITERRYSGSSTSTSRVTASRPSSDAVNGAIVKILGATIANVFAKDQDQNDGLIAALFSVGARAGRDKLIESALKDVFPELQNFEIRGIRRVVALYLDDQLSLGNLGAETAKEEIIAALEEEDPALGKSAQIVNFIYELHKAKSR